MRITRNDLKLCLMAAVAAGVAHSASALNYSSGDLLLVFRQDGQKDVEFDLGSVTNFLGKAVGTRVPVSYNASLVRSSFNNNLAGVKFAIVGTTPQTDTWPRLWLSDASVYMAPANLTYSQFGVLSGKLDNVGIQATLTSASNSAPVVIAASAAASYDYIVTGGALSSVTTLYGDSPVPVGGGTPLPVDAVNPTTVALYQVQISTAKPKPAATLVGAFTLDVNGNLTFTAGALPPLPAASIAAINADVLSGATTVSFSTTAGASYRLLYAPVPRGPWQPVLGAGLAVGDGSVQSLSDTDSSDPARFYRIESLY